MYSVFKLHHIQGNINAQSKHFTAYPYLKKKSSDFTLSIRASDFYNSSEVPDICIDKVHVYVCCLNF